MPDFHTSLANRFVAATLHQTYYISFYSATSPLTIQSRSCFTNTVSHTNMYHGHFNHYTNYIRPMFRLSFASLICNNYTFTSLATNHRLFSTTKVKSSQSSKKKSVNKVDKSAINVIKPPGSQKQSQPASLSSPTGIIQDLVSGNGSTKSSVGKPHKPVVPILYYTATKRATESVNHRLFYINVLFIIFLYDIGTGLIDY